MKLQWERIKASLLVFGKYSYVIFVLNLLPIPNSFISTCIWKRLQTIAMLPFALSIIIMAVLTGRLSRDLLAILFVSGKLPQLQEK